MALQQNIKLQLGDKFSYFVDIFQLRSLHQDERNVFFGLHLRFLNFIEIAPYAHLIQFYK